MAVFDKYTSAAHHSRNAHCKRSGCTCLLFTASRCSLVRGPSVPLIAPTVPMGHSSVIPARSIRTWVSSLHAECD